MRYPAYLVFLVGACVLLSFCITGSNAVCHTLTCGQDMCDMTGAPDSLVLQYVGGGILDSLFSLDTVQGGGSGITVLGLNVNLLNTRIKVTGDPTFLNLGGPVYFDETVSLNQVFTVNASAIGATVLPRTVHIKFITLLGLVTQTIDLTSDCSRSLVKGDRYGAIRLVAIRTAGVCYPSGNECGQQNSPNPNDQCPLDPLKTSPGTCGCGTPETDTDADGTPDCVDLCPLNPQKIVADSCGCDAVCKNDYSVKLPNPDSCANILVNVADLLISPLLAVLIPGVQEQASCELTLIEYPQNGTARITGLLKDRVPGIIWQVNLTLSGYTLTPPSGNPKKDLLSSCYNSINLGGWRYYTGIRGTLRAQLGSLLEGALVEISTSSRYGTQIGIGANNQNKKLGLASAFTWHVLIQPTNPLYALTSLVTQGDLRLDIDSLCSYPGNPSGGGDDDDDDHDGIVDLCPLDILKLLPGFCGCGHPETDTDSDGVPDCVDLCPDNPLKSCPGKCGCSGGRARSLFGGHDDDNDNENHHNNNDDHDNDDNHDYNDDDQDHHHDYHICRNNDEDDSDGDGHCNCVDNCPSDPLKTQPGICGCGVLDIDTDLDGTPDCHDGCPLNPLKVAPGQCGCSILDIDLDGDGVAVCLDLCPLDILKVAPGVCGCGITDVDTDHDGTPDCLDICPLDPLKIVVIGLCGCSVPETDTDHDGTPDCIDFCPFDPLKIVPGSCGCGLLDINLDQVCSPLFGNATTFAVLASSTITNTGPSIINGSIGVVPGSSITGFPPGIVNGLIHQSDALALLARTDAQLAYTLMGLRPCTNVLPAILGPLQVTLTPGVYCAISSVNVIGNVLFDGLGDPNAVFIIKIPTALTTASGVSLTTTGGALPGNVFFHVGSSATLGTGTRFQGNIIAGVSVTATTGTSVVGRLIALVGAVTLDTTNVTLSFSSRCPQACDDSCPLDPLKNSPGQCGCLIPDVDLDQDGVADCLDGCPLNPELQHPGVCGCLPTVDSDQDGTPDCLDGCPFDILKLLPGLCGCNQTDTDQDHDGIPDCLDGCPLDPLKIVQGLCGCGAAETDSDHDGVPNCLDLCPYDPRKILPGLCGCSVDDLLDQDHDLVPDCLDGCPLDPLKITQGLCGCSYNDTDTDRDGVPDCLDLCPGDPLKLLPGICGCNIPDRDQDHDLVLDCLDGCPLDPLKIQPLLCGCGVLELDSDGDCVPDCLDACPQDPHKIIQGICGCGTPDVDTDHDLVFDCFDGCPQDPHKILPGQCGCGYYDTDTDYDGVADCVDGCPLDPTKTNAGSCGCGIPESQNCGDDCPSDPLKTSPGRCGCGTPDTDTDSDGVPDCMDGCPTDPMKTSPGRCGCLTSEIDRDYDGTPDCLDGCPSDPHKTSAGLCGCGIEDCDTDNDGVPDCHDGCPLNPLKTSPGTCGCLLPDRDSDHDGIPDCLDGCPNDPIKTLPGLCGCGSPDTDTDGDHIPDCLDYCDEDPLKTYPGICGCGVPDVDTDHDLVLDCLDGCPLDPLKIHPHICGCGYPETDSDLDGTPDCVDSCPFDPLKNDSHGACGCGVLETDTDHDGTPDCIDACPLDPRKALNGTGECGCGGFEVDTDHDGVPDCLDGCPHNPSKTTPGSCGCSTSDVDRDGDGTPDCLDNCPLDPYKTSPGICGCSVSDVDSDHDGVPDCFDGCNDLIDSDYDGVSDCLDCCPHDRYKTQPGICGCGISDHDSDHDLTPDCIDHCAMDPLKVYPGQCGCGHVDLDSDLDGVPDCIDGCPLDPLKSASPGACGCGHPDVDLNCDGIPDCLDQCPGDPLKNNPGRCGCGVPETDSDLDGTPNCVDQCQFDPTRVYPGVCGCGGINDQLDTDHDGTPDCLDGCPFNPLKTAPGRCGCNSTDVDTDHDGVVDCEDLCPYDPYKTTPGRCGCGTLDTDTDHDGEPDCCDGCPLDPHKTRPGNCGCGHCETPQCCECNGISSITFEYRSGGGQHQNVSVAIGASNNALPLAFTPVYNGDYFTLFGTFGVNDVLGPNHVQIQLFDQGSLIPFHTEWVDVTCDGTPADGTRTSNYLTLYKSARSLTGSQCPVPCNFTLAISVDLSNDTDYPRSASQLTSIKHSLNNGILQKLAGDSTRIALYGFSGIPSVVQSYVAVDTLIGVQTLLNAINTLSFSSNSFIQWSPTLTQMSSTRPAPLGNGPDIALLLLANALDENIALAALAAGGLKNSGQTRIVALDLSGSGAILPAHLQAITGPFYNQDYYILGYHASLYDIVDSVALHLCCQEDKDQCQVCHSDSTSCTDCTGTPGGNAHYDVCGVCNGDGSSCPPVECSQNATLSVRDKTSLEIKSHDCEGGLFEFIFNTTYQPHTGVVVGFDPYERCGLRQRGTCDNRLSSPADGDTWCDLFTVEYPDESLWKRTLNLNSLCISYAANFSLYDLLNCRDPHGMGPLLDTITPWKDYSGTLYANVVKAQNCSLNAWDDDHDLTDDDEFDTDCELSKISTFYDFELSISNSGVLSSLVHHHGMGFHGEWIRNIWLLTGDVQVEFSTFIDSPCHSPDCDRVSLCNATILRGDETGVPYHIVGGTECLSGDDFDDSDHVCKQIWQIRTVDAHGIMDFSGIKPVQFDICGGDAEHQVVLTLNLTITRGPDPILAAIHYTAWLGFYRDFEREQLVSPIDCFTDCTNVYALVRLECENHHPLFMDKILLCVGTNGLGDPLPYDSLHPATTGCNTPGIGIEVFTLYDRQANYENPFFEFSFDYPSGGHIWESFWKFEAKAISEGAQLIEVHWSVDSEADQNAFSGLVGRSSFVPQQYPKTLYAAAVETGHDQEQNWWDLPHQGGKQHHYDDDDDDHHHKHNDDDDDDHHHSRHSKSSSSSFSSSSSSTTTVEEHSSESSHESTHKSSGIWSKDDSSEETVTIVNQEDTTTSSSSSSSTSTSSGENDHNDDDNDNGGAKGIHFSQHPSSGKPAKDSQAHGGHNSGSDNKPPGHDHQMGLRPNEGPIRHKNNWDLSNTLKVVCSEGHQWDSITRRCESIFHSNGAYFTTHLWLLVLLVIVFVCIILACLYACNTDDFYPTLPMTQVEGVMARQPPPYAGTAPSVAVYHSSSLTTVDNSADTSSFITRGGTAHTVHNRHQQQQLQQQSALLQTDNGYDAGNDGFSGANFKFYSQND